VRNLLRDVNVEAISLVTKGANRKVFHLRKSEAELDDLIELPGPHRLVKADDWSAVYCVVAEPGWEEAPGIGAPDQAIPDVWADEDEIRKAAHRFMENGALVNCLHKGLERWGQIVENYIVPTDFDVDGQTIKKGSWVVAISPTPAGRDAIEKGEFTGISIEGTGMRELIEKGEDDLVAQLAKQGVTGFLCSNCGHFMPPEEGRDRGACPSCRNRFRNAPVGYIAKAADLPAAIAKDALLVPNKPGVTNWIERAGGLPKYIADIAGDLISEKRKSVSNAIQMAIGIVRNWARGQGGVSAATRGKAAAAVAEYEAKRAKAHLTKADAAELDEGDDEVAELASDPALIAKAEARESASTGILGSLGSVAEDSRVLAFFKQLARRSGMPEDEISVLDELEKSSAQTFAGIYAERDLEDELPDAFDALRSSIYRAFNPMPGEDGPAPAELIAQSLDEFKAWVEATLKEATTPEAVQKVRDDVALDAIVTAAIAKAGADGRAAQVKSALAAAKKKHPDGIPPDVRKAIFKDPAKWLASNGDKVAKADALADEAIAWTAEEAERAEADDAEEAVELLKAARTFSAAERKRHAASGAALPDGSYPIPDKGALKRAMQSVGRAPTSKRAKVKAHIRRRAKALGATSMLSEAFAKVAGDGGAGASMADPGSLDFEMGFSAEERQEFDELKARVEGLPDEITKQLGDTVDAAIAKVTGKPADDEGGEGGEGKGGTPAGDAPTAADLQKAFDAHVESTKEFIEKTDGRLGEIAAGIEKLGEGGSSQGGDPPPDPGEDAYKDQGVSSDLVGIL
jgi:hypothetical protein